MSYTVREGYNNTIGPDEAAENVLSLNHLVDSRMRVMVVTPYNMYRNVPTSGNSASAGVYPYYNA